jgi:hypothetical protein
MVVCVHWRAFRGLAHAVMWHSRYTIAPGLVSCFDRRHYLTEGLNVGALWSARREAAARKALKWGRLEVEGGRWKVEGTRFMQPSPRGVVHGCR